MEQLPRSRDGGERRVPQISTTPHLLRLNGIDPIQSPETPHPASGHSRQLSESRHLLPSPKNLFEYSATTNIRFGDVYIHDEQPFPDWNGEPQTLGKTRVERWRDAVVDLVMIALPLPFFALAAAVIGLHGKAPEDRQEDILKQFNYIAATLLPLIFSLIVGRLSIKLASYYLERGSTLGLLERLMGSRSFFNTLITQFRLWPLNLLALSLIFIWLLSPTSSQAALRMLSRTTKATLSNNDISYFNTRQASIASDQNYLNSWFPIFTSLFTASILAPVSTKSGATDLWANVKIPLLSSLSNISTPNSDGWFTIPPTNSTQSYTSLFGIPIRGLVEGNTTFSLESSYLDLQCHNITSNITRENNTFLNPNLISPYGPFISSQNITASTSWALGFLGPDITSFLPESQNTTYTLDALPSNITNESLFPGLLLYQDFTGSENVTSIYCAPKQAYVESIISCSSTQCAVTAQRPSTLTHAPEVLTLLNFRSILFVLTELLPLSTPQPLIDSNSSNDINILQNYLTNPLNNTFIRSTPPPSIQNSESRLLTVPLLDFGTRLSQILNTFLQGSMLNSTLYLTGIEFMNGEANENQETTMPIIGTDASTQIGDLAQSISVPGNVTVETSVFACSWPWVSVYLLATVMMFGAAIAAAVLKRMIVGRDYLGYVSSVVREGGKAGMPCGGARINGMERSRRLRDLKIRLGDVGDGGEGFEIGVGAQLSVGRVGIGGVGREGIGGLERGKLYV